MSPALRRLLRNVLEPPYVRRTLFFRQCLVCGRPMDTRLQRVWHWLRCWRSVHPRQG